jgi:hypothetical protein
MSNNEDHIRSYSDALGDTEQQLVDLLRAPVAVNAREFDARVMNAVRQERAFGTTRTRRHYGWVAGVSLAGSAIAAAVTFLVVGARAPVVVHQIPGATAIAPAETRTVHFSLVASGASHVTVAGSFNGWNTSAMPLRRVDNDTWATDVPLDAGRYVYQFVIDGKRWVPDPRAPRDAGDDFGETNSVVTVPASA